MANNKMNIFGYELTPIWLPGTNTCVYTSTRKQEVVILVAADRKKRKTVLLTAFLIPTLC